MQNKSKRKIVWFRGFSAIHPVNWSDLFYSFWGLHGVWDHSSDALGCNGDALGVLVCLLTHTRLFLPHANYFKIQFLSNSKKMRHLFWMATKLHAKRNNALVIHRRQDTYN